MQPKRILLAEDDADDAQFFAAFITGRADVELLPVVENGEALLNYLESLDGDASLPDAIVLDQNMPKRNGLQTLRLLKQTDRYNHIPVMVYSTYADENLMNSSAAAGAAFVVPKPVDGDGYHKLIDVLLERLR